MAVHLRMDFKILELSDTLHILQCQRTADPCEHGVEYNPKQSGALARAIHDLRLHTCSRPTDRFPARRSEVIDIRQVVNARPMNDRTGNVG